MELAKAFEPANIERRWYPEWEAKNYFAAGVDRQKSDNFCIPVSYTHLDVYKRQPKGNAKATITKVVRGYTSFFQIAIS